MSLASTKGPGAAAYSAPPGGAGLQGRQATAPPKLLDLAALSSMLVGKGVKAKLTLATYQKMYEDQVVSYPRTEDKTITPEQFNELAPLVDRIAGVVGVDAGLLTHRQPRSTHVKAQGAHGANRPGPKVPASLDEVESRYGNAGRLIYETLAKNYLAMLARGLPLRAAEGPRRRGTRTSSASPTCRPLRAGGWSSTPDAGDDDAAASATRRGREQPGSGLQRRALRLRGCEQAPGASRA